MKSKESKEKKVIEDMVSDLPKDILIEIFKYCDAPTLINASHTSKVLCEASSSDEAWKSFFSGAIVQKDYKKQYLADKEQMFEKNKQLYQYQSGFDIDSLPKIKVLTMGNAVDSANSTVKTYPLKLNYQRNSQDSVTIDSARVYMGPKKQKIIMWDTASQERFMMISVKSYIRDTQLVLVFPGDVANLKMNKNVLDELEFAGPILCCANQDAILVAAKEMRCDVFKYEGEVPTNDDITRLNKTIIQIAGPDSVKDLIKTLNPQDKFKEEIKGLGKEDKSSEDKKDKKPPESKCTIM